jgi:N-acyl-D-amino-acid deacylase
MPSIRKDVVPGTRALVRDLILVVSFQLMALTAAGESVVETVIRNATVIDGTGGQEYLADVRIRGTRIVEIGDDLESERASVIDASGLVLAPGFIDTHSHHDVDAASHRDMRAAVSQGITTIVVGADGGSPRPLGEFFETLESSPLAVNVASYSGHNSIRAAVLGEDYRRAATDDEISRMRAMLTDDMAVGALGLSTGLEYDPGIYSETTELIVLAEAAAAAGGRYASHLRSEDRFFWEALEELLIIGAAAEIPVHVSHIKLAAKSLWGRGVQVRQELTAARARGLSVTADIYPYEYWASTMAVLLPERDFSDRVAIQFALDELAPPETIYLVRYLPEVALEGMTISQIAARMGEDPAGAYSRLLLDAVEYRQTNPGAQSVEMIVAESMKEADIATLLDWEFTNICSDGSHQGHPRGWGSYPRILGRYVREADYLQLPRAIRKMTTLAAENVGLDDRGLLQTGAFADLVLFDPETVIDNATIENPTAPADGIRAVWTNGALVYRDGSVTGKLPGRVLRHAPPQAFMSEAVR